MPLPQGGGATSPCLSRFWLKKNSISWKCIPSNQYITGGTKHWLSYMRVQAIWRWWGKDGMCCCVQWGILHVLNSQCVYPESMVGDQELNGTTKLAGIPEYLTNQHTHRCKHTSHMHSMLKRLHCPHAVQPSLVHQIVTRIYFVDFSSSLTI